MPDGTEAITADKSSQQSTGTSTYTEDQVKERERKARSDALADAGRARVEAERATKAAQSALDRLSRMEQDRIEGELESYKDDPAEIRRIRAEQKAKQLESELAIARQELDDERATKTVLETEKRELSKTQIARDIATRLNVNIDQLVKLSKYTDGTLEAIEELASELPKGGGMTSGRPDSNQGNGGGERIFTAKELGDRAFWEANREEILKAEAEGRIRK